MNKPITQSEFDSQIETVTSASISDKKKKSMRKKLLIALLATVKIGAIAYFGYDELIGSRYVTTDNAYVGAETAQVTPLVGGPVKAVRVSDTEIVNQGDVLVMLDDTDAQLALAQAEAALAQAERRVRGYFANDEGLTAQVAARAADQARAAADLVSAQSTLDRARVDFERRKALVASGSVSGDELTASENAFRKAEAALAAARANQVQAAANREAAIGTMNANAVLTRNTTVETNPEVANARALQARVDLERTIIRAPISGVITNRDAQVGPALH
jgi:membrane fusion protein (multidrug efflux system)